MGTALRQPHAFKESKALDFLIDPSLCPLAGDPIGVAIIGGSVFQFALNRAVDLGPSGGLDAVPANL
jgi:hypothetical protein